MKHKSSDYKLSAVKYYINHNDGYDKTCKIFDYIKSLLFLFALICIILMQYIIVFHHLIIFK